MKVTVIWLHSLPYHLALLEPGDIVLGALGSRRKTLVRDYGRNLKRYAFPTREIRP